jgi:hypothetical protein
MWTARLLALMEGCWAIVTASGLAPVATIWQDGTLTDDDLNAGFAVMFEHCPWADGPAATIDYQGQSTSMRGERC